MLAELHIRQATPSDTAVVLEILNEAAQWLVDEGMPLWKGDELQPATITREIEAGLFFLAECQPSDASRETAGTVKFQLEDPVMWPDADHSNAAYIHRLAVRRKYAGHGLSTAMMRWAVERTRELGRRYLRLDTEASRLRLRAVYEKFGFYYHSDREAPPYYISRYEYDVAEQP